MTNLRDVWVHDKDGNGIESFRGGMDVHVADAHDLIVNKPFSRKTGVSELLTSAVTAGDTVLNVVDGSVFSAGDPLSIENGAKNETTFPVIVSISVNALTIDRPMDKSFAINDTVYQVVTNMTVTGSLASPVSFKLTPDIDFEWHIIRFLLGMSHAAEADDSKFGGISALTNGVVLRGYNGTSGTFSTFTNWKTNLDMKMDMFDINYTTKAGGGTFSTAGRGSIKNATEAAPKVIEANGDYLELLIQDDLTGLTTFEYKAQGHVAGN